MILRLALRALIDEGGIAMASAAVAQRAGTTTPSLQTALKQLEQRELIRPSDKAGRTRWVPVDPFFGAWLRMAQQG